MSTDKLAVGLRARELWAERDAALAGGAAALERDAFDVALAAHRRALELDPTCATAHANIGWIEHLAGRYDAAIAACRAAIALRPDLVLAHVNLALSLLVRGDFARGWDEYAWLWALPERVAQYRRLAHATWWNGEPFIGRRLLVTLDQGLGDAIQMARYFPALKARGGHVSVEVLPPLAPLFAGLPGIDELRTPNADARPADDVDVHIPLLALPRLLGTHDINAIPAPIPYLQPQPDRIARWRPRLRSSARLRIGIAWAGNPEHPNDRRRSVRLEDFSGLADGGDIAWFGLQKGRDEARSACGSLVLDPLGPDIGDLADSAAIIAQLDLVIAVDTALVHLAGALGKPVWTLLAFAPDWRWLLDRDDSPWYPTMRLFRQPSPGDWASVFANVARELRAFDPATRLCSDGSADARARFERAKALAAQGDPTAAIASYESLVAEVPDFALAHSNLGGLYLQAGRLQDALSAYRRAVDAKPDFAPLSSNLAAALIELGHHDEALAACRTALRLDPQLAAAHDNMARAYRRSGRERDALDPAMRAIDARPSRAAYIALGATALGLDAFEVAIAANQRALELDPACAGAHNNLGGAYHALGRYAEAIAACDAAIALQPDFALARFNRGLSRLICGDFERGWADYEWAWRVPANRAAYPYLDRLPLWAGEPCAGQRLLLTLDQGLGDAIQFVRYASAVKARGAHVIVEVTAPLLELFMDVSGIDELRIRPEADPNVPDVDAHIPLFGLPRALGTRDIASIPAPIPYLHARPERIERWRPRLGRPARLRVGIVWAGNPEHANDRHRSARLEDFAVLADVPGIAWYGLQKGRDEKLHRCGALEFDPLGADIADFADSAAIVELLDLVIAVDTSIVHLAGALGKPVWTLLPFAPDWRWLLARDDSPWYPTMRLFRQTASGDWAAVFATVAHELGALVARAPSPAAMTDALASTLRALDLRPDRAAYIDLGAAAVQHAAYDIALAAFTRALAFDPACVNTTCNIGVVHQCAGRYPEAIAAFEAAIALRPQFALAHFNLGLALLARGEFARGWREYVWSWRIPAFRAKYRYLDRVPLWNGEAFAGRTLVVALDQGFGDAIQMLRYLPAVKARGGNVVLEILAPLLPVCRDVPGVDELRVVSADAPLADADLHIPLLGLPAVLGTNDLAAIPGGAPYLRAQSERIERWRARLERPAARLRVGIVWAGDPIHGNDVNRSVRLEDFAALAAGGDDIAWFGLQKGRDEERSECGAFVLDPLGAQIADFGDSAAIVAQLDLVIAVDTSIVHLAGALGKPVWTLLPFVPDWRWLLDRRDSPWYPTMRLFRQPALGDWASVFAAVARELRVFSPREATLRACAAALRASAPRLDRDAYIAWGAKAYELDAFELAAEANQRALQRDATCATAQCNLGWIHHVTGRYPAAIACLEAALAVQPDFALAHFNLGLTLLASGDFARGWEHYSWFRRLPEMRAHYPYLDVLPLWRGEPFGGRRLLISRDQGFGDALQMVRFLPAVKARGGQVVLEVLPQLAELFAGLPGVDELRIHRDDAPSAEGFDLQVPIMDLPRALAIESGTIPAPVPYLQAPRERIERWHARLQSSARLRVGITWSGNPAHSGDRHRSARLADFAALADVADIAWFGLQKGPDEASATCGSFRLDPLGAEIIDFADTAAIVTQLDLIIAVDTAIVHLAGALGKPVWTLLSFAPDWRWQLEREASPWYPTMRLFRQTAAGDWAAVFAAVATELRAFAAGPPRLAPSNVADAAPAQAHYERAKRCAADGDIDAAIRAYGAAVAIAPDFAEAHSNLGTLLLQKGRHADALHAFETAIRCKPELPALYCNLAAAQIGAGRFDQAVATAQTALRLAPDLYAAHANLCRAYEAGGREREAIGAALRATDFQPDPAVYVDLGVAAFRIEAFDLAIEANMRALAMDSAYALAYENLGAVYHLTGRYEESIEAGSAAIALAPDSARAHFTLGLSLLVSGRFARGWDEFAWVWRLPTRGSRYPYLDRVPLWRGEAFDGRRLLIAPDQGFGDAIQMVRLLPAVKARGGHVIVEVRPPLAALFAGLAGVDEVRVRRDAEALSNDIDLHVPVLGLPGALGIELDSIPAAVPYLRAPAERSARWRPVVDRPGCVRVGIAWAGHPGNENDCRRSVRLDDFAGLADVPGIAWFGLQKGRDDTLRTCGALTIEPLGPRIADFADTAAIVEQLDLIIAVDTSLVHVAGALGKPVWTLLPFAPDWRWLRERADSPWYPTMRLFRQRTPGDWSTVFAEIEHDLRDFVARAAERQSSIALAAAAFEKDDFDAALAAFERVRSLDPNCAKTHANLGAVYHMAGRYAEAIEACDAAIALQPDFATAHVNRALSLLVQGDFVRGWDEYIWTWRVPTRRRRYDALAAIPLWNGDAFHGRLLLTADQGFGDAIQLARYLPAVAARGGCVRLEVKAPLAALFADLPGVAEFAAYRDDPPSLDGVDLHLPLSGLPRAFATDLTSIPGGVPYLRAPAERIERWRSRLVAAEPLRIGIAWSGSATNHRRAAALDDFAAWGEIDGLAWFSLQKGRDENRRSCGPLRLEPLGPDIADFADTAAIVAQLDLIVSVDTALAHLAGALGKPVWTLLPYAPDWRWSLERDDSPWYPTMRLFRQRVPGDWATVAGAVARELHALTH